MAKKDKCHAKGCKCKVEFLVPADLCLEHWRQWFCAKDNDTVAVLKKIKAGKKVKQL